LDFVRSVLTQRRLTPKIERGHDRDLADVREMLRRGLVDAAELRRLYSAVEADLPRYPAIDADVFREKLDAFLDEGSDE
jgi:hypothetical protein